MNPFFDGVTPIKMPQGGPNPNLRAANVPNPPAPQTPGFGGYLQAGSAVLQLGLDAYGMANQGLNLDTQIDSQVDPYGRPTYNAGGLQSQASSAKPQGATFGEVGSGTLKGASAGLTIGGPVGAAIGAGVGGISAGIGGTIRRNRQRREKNKALAKVSAAQKEYNAADVSYRNQNNLMEDYQQMSNPNRRIRNLYQ